MAIELLDFVRNSRRLIKQALGKHAGKPASGGLPRWVHVAVHCIRIEEEYTYGEVIDRLSLMPDVCELLGLLTYALPDLSTFCHSFDRFYMWVWRALRPGSAGQPPPSGPRARHSTFFERGHASQYYLQRSDRDIQKLKVTTITDTESLAVLDLHCSIHWKHDVKAGPQVVRRNADDLLSVAADKAFHSWITTFEFYTLDVDPLVLRQGSTPETVGHNALIREKGYSQRWMAETSYSTTKRSLGPAERARGGYREFRENVLMFAVENIKHISKTL